MIDQKLEPIKGFKSLGYENGWPYTLEGNRMIVTEPVEVELCKKLGHQRRNFSTRYGQHHRWCDTCKIEWWMDSGD